MKKRGVKEDSSRLKLKKKPSKVVFAMVETKLKTGSLGPREPKWILSCESQIPWYMSAY